MELLAHLLKTDPACPRLTVYDETQGSRLDFSATTLDNWAAKVANLLVDEFDLEPDTQAMIVIDLPSSWQTVCIVLGAIAAGVDWHIGSPDDAPVPGASSRSLADAEVLFCTIDRLPDDFEGDICLVSNDPLGRGIAETGGTVPEAMVDFGPTVRMYGDQYFNPTPTLPEAVATLRQRVGVSEEGTSASTQDKPARTLSTGWIDTAGLLTQVLQPLAQGGSTVVVNGMASQSRLAQIAQAERVS